MHEIKLTQVIVYYALTIADPSTMPYYVFTHKMVKTLEQNLFSSIAYECPECTFEQWESIVPPTGWKKGPAQIGLFSAQDSVMKSRPSVEGHPSAVDFLEDVPGEEYKMIGLNQNST